MEELLELKVFRKWYNEKCTIGELYAGFAFFCFTLEDKVRKQGVKIKHETAIPSGKYDVIVDKSTRFRRDMPHILNVKGFDGVRIHAGNTDRDTSGCLLVGFKHGEDCVWGSADAFAFLFQRIKAAKKITLEIFDL